MGAINIIIGAFTLLIFLLVIMQPVTILTDQLASTIYVVNTTMYGTDYDGNVVAVGDSIWGADLVVGIVMYIGLAFFVGFLIWAGRGGQSVDESSQGGF